MRELLGLVVVLAACGGGGGGEAMQDGGPDLADAGTADVDDVFDHSRVSTFRLTIADEDWQWLQAHAREETYVPADLDWEGVRLGRVAVRYKGGYGTLVWCFDGQGNQICPKLSMKLKFDEYVAGQRFAGLKRLNLHAMHYDVSHMKDRLAYDLYRSVGVPAPRSAHARLVVNGEDQGLYAVIEAIDGEFTEDHFGAIDGGEGNLYKEVWLDDTADDFRLGLETNEEVGDVDRMVRFAAAVNGADASTFRDVLEQWMDVPQLVQYLAVDRFIDNWDGIIGWYCLGPDFCLNHNYFWYESSDSDRVWLLPWDMDNTMQQPSMMRDTFGIPDWDDQSGDCALRDVFQGIQGRPPACDRTLRLMYEVLADDYWAATQQLLQGMAAPGWMEAEIDQMEALLAAEVDTDVDGPSLVEWQAAVDDLRADLALLRARVTP
jgi:spore coat protein H